MLLVRPENMTLTGGPEVTSVSGKIDDLILLGGVVRHFVRCEDQSTIIVQELNKPGRPIAKRGRRGPRRLAARACAPAAAFRGALKADACPRPTLN